MEHKKFTIVVIAAVTSLLLAGTNLAPVQSYASSDISRNATSPSDGFSEEIRADLQQINQENLCFRSNTCRQSDVGQNTHGNDNQVTGFVDQSDNIQQSTAPTTANQTTPTPTPTPTTATLTVIKIVTGTTTAKPSNFTMHVSGFNPKPANFAGSADTEVTLSPGTFSVTETPPSPNFITSLSSECSGTIAAGQHLTCTVTNKAKSCEECFTTLLTADQINSVVMQYSFPPLTLAGLCDVFENPTIVTESTLILYLTNAGVSITTANELVACLKAHGILFA
jgi:hypothetical protein